MAKVESAPQPIITGIADLAEELAATATPIEERQLTKEHRKKIKKEHRKHQRLISRANQLLWDENKTAWHVDKKPTIPGLPQDATIAYRLKERQADEVGMVRLQVRLQVGGNDKTAKTTIASLGEHLTGPNRKRHLPFVFRHGDESRAYPDGVVMGKPDNSISPLTPIHSSTEGFALVERAISIIEAGEPKPPMLGIGDSD